MFFLMQNALQNTLCLPDKPDVLISIFLSLIFFVVLLFPFLFKKIEHNLEAFLFGMGVVTITINHFFLKLVPVTDGKVGPAFLPNWNLPLIIAALEDPIKITLAVFVAGLLFHYGRERFKKFIEWVLSKIPSKLFIFGVIVILGLLSSIITAIVAALFLVEIISILKLHRKEEVTMVVVACFAIGLGAALSPVGEPLSTIVIDTKLQENFWFLFHQIGKYIIPGVIALGIYGMFFPLQKDHAKGLTAEDDHETVKDVGIRAFKVYIFVMALVFLGTGFLPITEWYIRKLTPGYLYWANIVSAILDNATLASAEISKEMTILQLDSALMALLVAGGILIPGNIPNIICASKLKITSKEWAKVGVPLGVILMAIYFVILFIFEAK